MLVYDVILKNHTTLTEEHAKLTTTESPLTQTDSTLPTGFLFPKRLKIISYTKLNPQIWSLSLSLTLHKYPTLAFSQLQLQPAIKYLTIRIL